jgi:Bacteriophage Lambda NinG protein
MPHCPICEKVYFSKICESESCQYQLRYRAASKKSKIPNLKLKSLVKFKPCKGTTQQTAGFGCNLPNKERKFGLGISCKCYINWLLNSEKGNEYLNRVTLKITAPRVNMEKAIIDRAENIKLGHLLINVRNICHDYIRTRDNDLNCISCNIPYRFDFQAGHFYKAELISSLKFDEKNINGQCVKCNLRKEGNESGYRIGIIDRFGQERLTELDNMANLYKQNNFTWNRVQLEETRKYYQRKLKDLKNNL